MHQKQPAPIAKPFNAYPIALWLVVGAGTVFFLPGVPDLFLTPRFFLLSTALLLVLGMMWNRLRHNEGVSLQAFDVLLLAFYALNLASAAWAFSISEALFFSQKMLLLLLVYFLVKEALLAGETNTLHTLHQIALALAALTALVLMVQLAMATTGGSLDNNALYRYTIGMSGNKGLASNSLFFLAMLLGVGQVSGQYRRPTLLLAVLLATLILLLQTRAVYLAVAAAGLWYIFARLISDPAFKPVFVRRILPVLALFVLAIAAFVILKGKGNSFAERLNPATYMESTSALERRFVWHKTDVLIDDSPWYGTGNGSWKFLFPSKSLQGAYRMMEKNVVFTRAHNDLLEIRFELGLPGALLYGLLLFLPLVLALYTLRRSSDGPSKQRLLFAGGGLVGYAVIQFFDFPRERIDMQVYWAVFLALTAYECRDTVFLRNAFKPGAALRGLLLFLAAAGLLFNMFLGWKRFESEGHYFNALTAMSKNQWPRVEQEAKLAENGWNPYNEVVIPMAWYAGTAAFKLGKTEEALTHLERAYRLNPWSFQVINNYCSSLLTLHKNQEAIPLLEKAVEINPRYDEGKFNLAYAWTQLGDFEKANSWLNKVDTIPNPTTLDERQKNEKILQNLAVFRADIAKRQNKQPSLPN
ncbi:MAG: O-antigen ligase family protein [Saprospiraceae bacterium]|nr:O-antigen ligase family protein [Saprospiraceae bacterium]